MLENSNPEKKKIDEGKIIGGLLMFFRGNKSRSFIR